MVLNEKIVGETKRISWINENANDNAIYIDNSFQRRSVWINKNKVRFIESILTGHPIPELYFWAQESDAETGHARYSVVDGQQRISAIREFVSGQFRLQKQYLDEENQEFEFVNKYFKDLSPDDKRALWDYKIQVRIIPSDVSKNTIISMFLRLNETDKSLNPQELRHAEFNGEFITACETLADVVFWDKWNIFSSGQVRRMGDIQTCGRFLTFLRRGFDGDISQSAMDDMYTHYNENYPSRDEDLAWCKKVIRLMDRLYETEEKLSKFFKTQVHLYSLFVAILIYVQRGNSINIKKTSKSLTEFVDLYKFNDEDTDSEHDLTKYRLASNMGMLSRSGRELRVKKILSLLVS